MCLSQYMVIIGHTVNDDGGQTSGTRQPRNTSCDVLVYVTVHVKACINTVVFISNKVHSPVNAGKCTKVWTRRQENTLSNALHFFQMHLNFLMHLCFFRMQLVGYKHRLEWTCLMFGKNNSPWFIFITRSGSQSKMFHCWPQSCNKQWHCLINFQPPALKPGLEFASLEGTAVFALNFLVIAGHCGNFQIVKGALQQY